MQSTYKITLLSFLSVIVLLIGCGKSQPSSKPVQEPEKQQEDSSDRIIQDEPPLPVSVLSQLPSVQEILEKMVCAYKNLNSYTDQAYCQVYIHRENEVIDQSIPYSISYVKPNKLNFHSRTCDIRADGKTISVVIPNLPDVILQKQCPAELHLEDILFDREIDEAICISQTSQFSVLPLQWVLLFANDPLKTITFSQKEIRSLAPRELNGHMCYRLRIDRVDGTAILWIDEKSGLILRAQLPSELLVNSIEGINKDDCSLTVEFSDPQINTSIPDAAFQMEIPASATIVEHYSSLTTSLLGTTIPDFDFSKLDNEGLINKETIKDKITVMYFWTTWAKSAPMVQSKINKLQEEFAKDKEIMFLSISTDESQISDAYIRDSLKQWNVPPEALRDYNSYFLNSVLKINAVPALILLNKNGQIEDVEIGFNPMLDSDIKKKINQLKEGKSVYPDVIEAKRQDVEFYSQRMKQWLEQGIYVDADIIERCGIPETAVAQASKPVQFELKPLWTVSEITNPGGTIAIDSGISEFKSGYVWVLENGKKVVKINSEGKIEARYDLSLDSKEVCSFIRISGEKREAKDEKRAGENKTKENTTNPQAPVRFIAYGPGQQRFHVYDKDWKLLFHYPEDALKNPHPGIQDVRFGELENENEPKIYIGLLGSRGVQCIDMNGQLRWTNRSIGTVFSVAPYHGKDEKRLLCSVGSSGVVPILSPDGKMLSDGKKIGVIAPKGKLIAIVYAENLKNADEKKTPDSLCGLSVSSHSYELVGLNMQSQILWTFAMPQGIPRRPIDYITSGDIMPNGDSVWIALGSDGSIHFIDRDGILIDHFNHGRFVSGLTHAKWEGKNVLIITDDEGVKAYEIVWK